MDREVRREQREGTVTKTKEKKIFRKEERVSGHRGNRGSHKINRKASFGFDRDYW